MVSVGRLVYDIEADIADFQAGMTATRKEMGMAKKIIQQTGPAADRYNDQIAKMGMLHRKGALSTREFRVALRDTRREMEIANGSLKGMIFQLGKMPAALKATVAGFVGLAGARMAIGGLLSDMERIDVVAKTARKLGETTEELVGLQLAAAEFSGFTDAQLNMALQRMTRRVAEAAVGTGEAKSAIKALGLEASELDRMGPAEAFRQIAEAMRRVDGEGQQLRIAFKLFDSEGAGLVNTLNAGEAGLIAMRERAKELGIAFDETDAAGVEAANDAITEAKAAWEGAGRSFSVTFAPAVELAAKRVEQMAGRLKAVRDGFMATRAALEQWFKQLAGVRTESVENPFVLRSQDRDDNSAFLEKMHSEREAFNEEQRKKDKANEEAIIAMRSKETRDRIQKINEQYRQEMMERQRAAEQEREASMRNAIKAKAEEQIESVEGIRDRSIKRLENRLRLQDQERTQGGATAVRSGSAEEFRALARIRNREMNSDKALQERRNQLLEQIKKGSDDMIEAIRARAEEAIQAI